MLQSHGVADCVTSSNKDKEQLTISILNCVLFDIFYSMEPVAGYTYEELFAQHTDKKTLFEAMQPRGMVDWAEHDLAKPVPGNPEAFITVKTYPEMLEMTQVCFEVPYLRFRDHVSKTIMRALGPRFNPYSIVDLQCMVGRTGRVNTIELLLTGDIRHKFFMEKFPDGRYRTDNHAGSDL